MLHRVLLILAIVLTPIASLADAAEHSTVGVAGYDLVSYRTGEKPVRGNGNHVAVHDGVTYLFVDEANRKSFEDDPTLYLPAYGGYCAFGVSVGKKFVGDPDVWEIVDGTLYLNLDNGIKSTWMKDVEGNLRKADANWPRIRDRDPSEL